MKSKKSHPKQSPKKVPAGPGKKIVLAGGDIVCVRQRTKRDPVTAEGVIDPDGGHCSAGKDADRIRLTISTSPEGWEKLQYFAECDQEGLAQEVLRFVYAARAKTEPAPANKDEVIGAMKRDSRALYSWLRHWIRKEPAERPEEFGKIDRLLAAEGGTSGKYDRWKAKAVLQDMTMQCMKMMYEKALLGSSFRPFGNADSFYITYIIGSSALPSIALDEPAEHAAVPVAQRVVQMRVKRIFRRLGILPPR